MNHNSIGRGYETWGNGTAETIAPARSSSRLPWSGIARCRRRGRYLVRARQPELPGNRRRLPLSTTCARNAKEMLRNFYKKGWDSWQKGLNEARLSPS